MKHKDVTELFKELADINGAFRSVLWRMAILLILTLFLGVTIGWVLHRWLNN